MSGKIYTMKEMKIIVEYLNDHKAYGEVKGKKMWMDFASSNLTNRTWQSLKETFLKRILPDIHNPYYGLSREEIISFRQGYDVKERDKNKLDIKAVDEDSNSNGKIDTNIEKHIVTSPDDGDLQGETNKHAQVTKNGRSSQDNPEPQNCYKTVEDIRRDLESPKISEENKAQNSDEGKLPPAIQNLLNDFTSDSEEANKIVDDTTSDMQEEPNIESKENGQKDKPIENSENDAQTSDVDINDNNSNEHVVMIDAKLDASTEECVEDGAKMTVYQPTNPTQNIDSKNDTNKDHEKGTSKDLIKENTKYVDEKDESSEIVSISSLPEKKTVLITDNKNANKEPAKTSISNSSQSLMNTNSTLPNNQEGLGDNDKAKSITNKTEESNNRGTCSPRKRGSSADTIFIEKKRQKKNTKSKKTSDNKSNTSESAENSTEPEVFDIDDSSDAEAGLTTTQGDETRDTQETSITHNSASQNPCLQSVSLFAEQFNKTKYSDSSSSEATAIKDDPKPSCSKKNDSVPAKVDNDVVVLKSHSDSECIAEPQTKKQNRASRMMQAQRDKAFANVFGFSQGAASSSRPRKSSHSRARRPTNESKRHKECKDSGSDSSGWTTESEQGNFVLPPRGRRNRHTKKYLKPKSARILSLEEEGGLFVMYGKRIYPVVKDGKIVKNYVIYESNSDSGFDQESYWKIKYAELKKKYEEHKKMKEESERARENQAPMIEAPSSPILQSRQPPPTPQKQDVQIPSTSKTNPAYDKQEKVSTCPVENTNSNSKITIKYIVNNAEVQLEGHWPQICPIFDKVVNILPNKPEPQTNEPIVQNENQTKPEQTDQSKVIIVSGQSTPLPANEDAAARVEKLESEIFKEIAEKDNEEKEQVNNDQEEKEVEMVTSRKRVRKPKQSPPSESSSEERNSPRKQARISPVASTPAPREIRNIKIDTVEYNNHVATSPQTSKIMTRRTRQSLNTGKEPESVEQPKPKDTTPKEPNVKGKAAKSSSNVNNMLPPTTTMQTRRSNSRAPTTSRVPKPRSLGDQVTSQTDDILEKSESTQGYQDSDISPVIIQRKKKLKLSTITNRNRLQSKRNMKRRSHLYLVQESSTDSSNSSVCSLPKITTTQSSSEIYKSDSYQNLFPNKRISTRLEPIHEISPIINEIDMRPINNIYRNEINTDTMESDTNVVHGNADGGSSSNVSLPQSPELSVVEDISIGKEFLSSIREYHALKTTLANDVQMRDEESKYFITDVDVTMPLMEQMCELQRSNARATKTNASNREKKSPISESLINKICTVQINDSSSVSDSLDMQLRDLLLESAKKMSIVAQRKESTDVDENGKKTKRKKRCSTPRKKNEAKKSLVAISQATVEQYMEACSYSGRKSCPPLIQIHDDNAVDFNEICLGNAQPTNDKPKGRKKKDVIKVKILRPRSKSDLRERRERSSQTINRMSICTDSGINGTASGSSIPISNDSVELIHNHSETCLHANECVENSVEFVNASMSIISLNSNSYSVEWQDNLKDTGNVEICTLNNNNEDFKLSCNNEKCTKHANEINNDTSYRSPLNEDILNNSLITEDLSDESPTPSRVPSRPSRWYLLSEDETTNTNFAYPPVPNTEGGFGANLNQIFPITCAVPNLSTITEMSKDNDTRKPSMIDSFTRDSDSQNIFM